VKECSKCGQCCRSLSFIIEMTDEWREYYEAHGCKVLGDMVLVPMVCPHLKDNMCDIYETRPQVCRDFKGQTEGYYVPPECTLK
jgi:Fe-S-cluster containining protein